MYLYGCQQVLIKPNDELKAILEFICQQANSLTKCGIYYARQLYFKVHKLIGKYDLETEYKTTDTLKRCILKLLNKYWGLSMSHFNHLKNLGAQSREDTDKPRPPKYQKSGEWH